MPAKTEVKSYGVAILYHHDSDCDHYARAGQCQCSAREYQEYLDDHSHEAFEGYAGGDLPRTYTTKKAARAAAQTVVERIRQWYRDDYDAGPDVTNRIYAEIFAV